MSRTLSIANGELWLHADGAPPRQIESPFARELLEREQQSRRTSNWKHAPREEQTGVIPSASLWGQRGASGGNANGVMPVRFLYACRADDDNTLYYVLAVGETRGLFRRYLDEEREVRLFHRTRWECLGLADDLKEKRLILT